MKEINDNNDVKEPVPQQQSEAYEDIVGEVGMKEDGEMSDADRQKLVDAKDELDAEIEGKIYWPDNKGAVEGTEQDRTLDVGEEFTRRTHTDTVNDDGSFAGEKGISFEESSLPGKEEDYDVKNYEVTKDMPDDYFVTESEVAPAHGQKGGGTQYEFKRENPWNPDAEPLNVPIQDLKDYGYIEEKNMDSSVRGDLKDIRNNPKEVPDTENPDSTDSQSGQGQGNEFSRGHISPEIKAPQETSRNAEEIQNKTINETTRNETAETANLTDTEEYIEDEIEEEPAIEEELEDTEEESEIEKLEESDEEKLEEEIEDLEEIEEDDPESEIDEDLEETEDNPNLDEELNEDEEKLEEEEKTEEEPEKDEEEKKKDKRIDDLFR